jgi:hypothetical protein
MMALASMASRILTGALAVTSPFVVATAQSLPPEMTNTDPNKRPVVTPQLKALPQTPGWKTAMLQGAADEQGHRFLVPSLDVLQPVAVILVPIESGDDLSLKLFKHNFEKPLREASTGGASSAVLRTRTQGGMHIQVASKGGVKGYQLVIMVGNEVKVPTPSLFVPVSHAGIPLGGSNMRAAAPGTAAGTAQQGGNSTVLWLIAGSLVVIVGLLVVILLRRGKSAQTGAILLFGLAASALSAPPLSAQETKPPEPIDTGELLKQTEELLTEVLKETEKYGKYVGMMEDFVKAYEALTAGDKDAWPEYSPPGMPGIPTACMSEVPSGVAKAIGEVEWTDPACGQCFEDAHKDIETTLQRFEKLRRVHAQTEEVYKTSVAFGDGASKVGGIITTAGWMKIRAGIKQEMEKYYVVYDDKFEELKEALIESLGKVAECEAKYFNNADWYDRYGFMFVNPVVERHRR